MICEVIMATGKWAAICVVAGVAGIVIPVPKQIFVGVPVGLLALIYLLSAVNSIWTFCPA